MGDLLTAQCNCGYSKGIRTGGGFISTGDKFPAFCRECKDIVEVNLNDYPATCPKCDGDVKLYNQSLARHRKRKAKWSWLFRGIENRTVRSPSLCPSCGNNSLEFITFALWD